MTTEFEDLKRLAEAQYPEAFAPGGAHAFTLALADAPAITFASLPGDPAAALVRTRVLDLASVPRAGAFAKAALAANFFWGGTRGATLSVGADGVLHLTERRPVSQLADADALAACIADFSRTTADWQERSALYA